MEILTKPKKGPELYRDFDKAVCLLMKDRGYAQIKAYGRTAAYIKPLGAGLYGTVANSTSRILSGEAGVNVYMHIGVTPEAAERLLCDMMIDVAVIKTKYYGPISCQLGISDISKRGHYADFERALKKEEDVLPTVNFTVKLVDTLVEPFFSKFKTQKDYIRYIEKVGGRTYKDQIIPIIYYLNGDKQKGEEYINKRLKDKKRPGYIDINDPVFLEKYALL